METNNRSPGHQLVAFHLKKSNNNNNFCEEECMVLGRITEEVWSHYGIWLYGKTGSPPYCYALISFRKK